MVGVDVSQQPFQPETPRLFNTAQTLLSNIAQLMTLPNEKMSSFLIFFPLNQILASANEDGTITVWDIVKESLITSVKCSPFSSPSIALSVSGNILICGDEKGRTIRRWNGSTFKELTPIPVQIKEKLTNWRLSADGSLMAGQDEQGYFQVFSTTTWERVGRLHTNEPFVIDSIAFSPGNEKIATIAKQSILTIWEWVFQHEWHFTM